MAEIPDLLRLSKVPSNLQQNVETDLIETSTFQEATTTGTGFARFDLQQKGFLHSHSKIFVGLIPKAGQGGFAHLPPNIGIGSLVQRAVLKCGNQTLNEIDDWSHLHMIKSAQGDNENNVEREYYTTGRVMNFNFIYPPNSVQAGVVNPARSANLSRVIGIDNGRDKLLDGVGPPGEYTVNPMPFAEMLAASPAESPVYAIDLSDLFPFLKTHSLPLYMIQQQISVELHWSPTVDKRVQLDAPKTAAADYLIDTNELKLCADYVYYTEGDVMSRYAEANRNLEFSFPDYRLSKSSVTPAQLGAGVVRNLGMANRLCSRVVTIVCDDDQNDQTLLGPYNSCCPERIAAGTTGNVKYNVRYNDRFEFPQALENKAQIFSHFQKSEGVLFLPTEVYADTYAGLGGLLEMYAGRPQARTAGTPGLAGNQWMMATRLTTGRVGVKGIELHLTQEGMNVLAGGANDTYTLRTYCEYARLARLEDGFLAVYNA
tara:strand:- start:747 stop:2204 length:1458 start_codon:yes stop_codon:yes gene_type:complete